MPSIVVDSFHRCLLAVPYRFVVSFDGFMVAKLMDPIFHNMEKLTKKWEKLLFLPFLVHNQPFWLAV